MNIKILTLTTIGIFCFPTFSFGQWKYIKGGIEIIQGVESLQNVIDWFRSDKENSDTKAVLAFSTNSYTDVSVYVNDAFIGYIKDGKSITCRVNSGYGHYKAIHSNGTIIEDNLYISSGTSHNIVIANQKSNLTYDIKKKECSINGSSVNLRSYPEIDPENIISKLSSYDTGEILDKMIVVGSNDDRIIINDTYFQPIDGTSSYKAYHGIAVKLIESYTDGTSKIRLFRKDGTSKVGYIASDELGDMKNKTWYKIEINGYIGWVYGDFVTENY